jgi:hypothetical protein
MKDRTLTAQYADVYHLRDGKITEHWHLAVDPKADEAFLGSLGLDPQARTEVLAVLNNYILGFAHRETARDQLIKRAGLTEQQWQQRLRHYAAHTRDRDPELARDIETCMHLTSNDSFEFGLDCLLNGIAMRFLNDATRRGEHAAGAQPDRQP